MNFKRIAAFTLFSSTMSSLSCQAFTGNDLQQWGQNINGNAAADWQSGSFLGYVAGVSDAFNDIAFCLPKGATYQQIGAIVMKSLKANPETWDKGGSFLVVNALKKTYPCPKQK